jgi:hypothetical protein
LLAAYTQASTQALENLRNTGHFGWYLIPILAFVAYIYVVEAERRKWDIFLAGFAFLGVELAWEMLNALVLHWSKRAAMWTAPGGSRLGVRLVEMAEHLADNRRLLRGLLRHRALLRPEVEKDEDRHNAGRLRARPGTGGSVRLDAQVDLG